MLRRFVLGSFGKGGIKRYCTTKPFIQEELLTVHNSPFQKYTLQERLPKLLDNVKQHIPSSSISSLEHLTKQLKEDIKIEDIPSSIHGKEKIHEHFIEHIDEWEKFIQNQKLSHRFKLEDFRPSIITEMYFYHRIVDAAGYFCNPNNDMDPFRHQKKDGFDNSLNGDMIPIIEYALDKENSTIKDLIQFSLWGNKADLSLIPDTKKESSNNDNNVNDNSFLSEKEIHSKAFQYLNNQKGYLLCDDSHSVEDYLLNECNNNVSRIDFVLDNAGLELFHDLIVSAGLLLKYPSLKIYLHAKWHPTFISDTTRTDITNAINSLISSNEETHKKLGNLLQKYNTQKRLIVKDDPCWTYPIVFSNLPENIKKDLSKSNLVIFKGDANYRRLVLDTLWKQYSFSDIVSYLPFNVLALRTVKAELTPGIDNDKMKMADSLDSKWRENGEWGVIQFSSKN